MSETELLTKARECMGWGEICENCGLPMGTCNGCEGCEEFLNEAVHYGCYPSADEREAQS